MAAIDDFLQVFEAARRKVSGSFEPLPDLPAPAPTLTPAPAVAPLNAAATPTGAAALAAAVEGSRPGQSGLGALLSGLAAAQQAVTGEARQAAAGSEKARLERQRIKARQEIAATSAATQVAVTAMQGKNARAARGGGRGKTAAEIKAEQERQQRQQAFQRFLRANPSMSPEEAKVAFDSLLAEQEQLQKQWGLLAGQLQAGAGLTLSKATDKATQETFQSLSKTLENLQRVSRQAAGLEPLHRLPPTGQPALPGLVIQGQVLPPTAPADLEATPPMVYIQNETGQWDLVPLDLTDPVDVELLQRLKELAPTSGTEAPAETETKAAVTTSPNKKAPSGNEFVRSMLNELINKLP